jgi:hypothetical protein
MQISHYFSPFYPPKYFFSHNWSSVLTINNVMIKHDVMPHVMIILVWKEAIFSWHEGVREHHISCIPQTDNVVFIAWSANLAFQEQTRINCRWWNYFFVKTYKIPKYTRPRPRRVKVYLSNLRWILCSPRRYAIGDASIDHQ